MQKTHGTERWRKMRDGMFAAGAVRVSSTVALAETPSYTKDVAPIFREKCEICHRLGQMGTMPLTTYEEARLWARSIKKRWRRGSCCRGIWIGLSASRSSRMTSRCLMRRWTSSSDGLTAAHHEASLSDLPPAIYWLSDDIWRLADERGISRSGRQGDAVDPAGSGTGSMVAAGRRYWSERRLLGLGHRDLVEQQGASRGALRRDLRHPDRREVRRGRSGRRWRLLQRVRGR